MCSVKKINTIARVALSDPHGERLLWDVLKKKRSELAFDVPFLSEELSIGFKLPAYKNFSEEQKLFLNHLSYFVHYYRITGAEKVAIQNNLALAKDISQVQVEKYLHLETQEELDHIKTFTTVMAEIANHYQLDTKHLKNKFLHIFSTNQFCLRTMIKSFGADYVLTYFISRGIFNHMGYAFENEVVKGSGTKGPIKELTKLHIIDEKRHMAISNLFSQAAREFIPETKVHRTLNNFFTPLQNLIIQTSFSERYTKKIEFGLAFNLMKQCSLFTSLEESGVKKFCEDHYGQITGIEEAKNKVMQPKNLRILETSTLSAESKVRWRQLMEENSGFLEFFPKAA